MTTTAPQPEQRPTAPPAPFRKTRLVVAGAGGAGTATLAFLLLVLCGVSGAAVLDPALGAWNSVIASRVDGVRAQGAIAADARLAGAAHSIRLPRSISAHGVVPSRVDDRAAHASAHARAAVSAGLLDLPPPARG